jgi:hypothetical protein
MLRALAALVLAGIVLGFCSLASGQETTVESKLLLGVPPEQVQALRESRIQAQKEIFKERTRHSPPEIVFCLRDPACLVAIARVTGVTPEAPQAGGALPNLRVDLELEQMLRGASKNMHVYTESFWKPIKSGYRFGHFDTALDREEPKPGKQYVIGYGPPGYGDDGMKITVGGAIDLSEPGQAQTFPDVQHFLNIEASGDSLNFSPFLTALDDPIHWIRDIAAYRLAESENCHTSRACGEAFIAHTSKLLQRSSAFERFDALEWLRPIVAAARVRKQPSSVSNNAVRELLQSATNDRNVVIGDLAFQYISQWDFLRSSEPGHCLEVIAPLRMSAVWDYQDVKGQSIRSALGSSTTCIPPSPTPASP